MAFVTEQAWQVSSGKNINSLHSTEAAAQIEAEALYPDNPTDTFYFEVVRLVEE